MADPSFTPKRCTTEFSGNRRRSGDPKMSEGQKFQLGTIGALSLSVVSSVSIVFCNKALISTLGFTFATTLTSWHLLVTFCSLHVALWMKMFEHKPFDPRAVMGFGVLNGISIGLLNLSLGFNSVGFYQMTKLANIPCTVLLETLFFRKKLSRKIQFSISLTILLLGVGIATVTGLQLNMLGSVLSLLAVITTCVAQIMTHTIQKKFKVSSTQLLYQSCPYQAITLFVAGPFLDGLLTNQNVFAFKYTSQVVFFIVLSCLISVSVNFSTFLVIGETSPVTYQVLGHLKTCLVLAFGYVLLRDPFNWRNILGIMVAVIGMVVYSYFCSIETQQKASETSTQLPQVSLSDLPEDLFLDILDRVGECEVFLVCRTWRRLDRLRQKSLTILESPVRFFPLRARGFRSLVSVIIDHRLADEPQPDQTTSTAGGRVVHLVTDEDLATLAAEFWGLLRLELLGCDLVTGAGLTGLVEGCPRLAYLHLQDCRHFDDDAVIGVVRSCPSLEDLRITFCEVSAAGIKTLGTLTRVSAQGCPRSEALHLFPAQV